MMRLRTLFIFFVFLQACSTGLKRDFNQVGLASWYGKKFHGRKTANGEIYNMHAMTAAHPTLPFGTWVLVKRKNTEKSVQVRINDRGPFVGGRILDLSYGAALKLDLIQLGGATVEIIVKN